MITVYGEPPTRALPVIWMLEEMELPYEVRAIDPNRHMNDAEFLEASPTGASPAIRDGDVRMMESCAILEYLGAKYGPTPPAPACGDPTYPDYMSFLHFGEASLASPAYLAIVTHLYAPEEQKQNWGSQFELDAFLRKSAVLAGPLQKHPFITGEQFTTADISCGYAAGLGHVLGVEDRPDPAVRDYYQRLTERPAFQRAMRHTQAVQPSR